MTTGSVSETEQIKKVFHLDVKCLCVPNMRQLAASLSSSREGEKKHQEDEQPSETKKRAKITFLFNLENCYFTLQQEIIFYCIFVRGSLQI